MLAPAHCLPTQANFGAMDAALAAMQRHVPVGSTVADLHAGVGTIGLSLAATRQLRWVRCVEISSAGEGPFQRSAACLRQQKQQRQLDAAAALADTTSSAAKQPEGQQQGEQQGEQQEIVGQQPLQQERQGAVQVEYHVAAAGSNPGRWCAGADVVVLDPPRKGLEPSLLNWLCSPAVVAAGTQRLLYLSCGFPALQRDAAALLGSGRWRLAHAEAFLFFPGADHIESLCVFDAVA